MIDPWWGGFCPLVRRVDRVIFVGSLCAVSPGQKLPLHCAGTSRLQSDSAISRRLGRARVIAQESDSEEQADRIVSRRWTRIQARRASE